MEKMEANVFKGPVGPLRHRCEHCAATGDKLLRCAGCRVVRYCDNAHQAADYARHKYGCRKVQKVRIKLAREEDRVRNRAANNFNPANAFDTGIGYFWAILGTRDYMRTRFTLAVHHLIPQGTLDSIREALHHLRDMLTLCRGDNLGARCLIPGLMLRLDMDQECYDFIKWWAIYDPNGEYNWDDMTSGYLDLRGGKPFECPGFLFTVLPDINHCAAMLTLKLKLVVDIRNIKVARQVLASSPLPTELRQQIEQDVVRSPLSAMMWRLSDRGLNRAEVTLSFHASEIGKMITHENHYFASHLFMPNVLLDAKGETQYRSGSWEHAARVMQSSYPAMWETEGVLGLLKDAARCQLETEENFSWVSPPPASSTNVTVMRSAVNVNVYRFWEFLDDAIEDASHIGHRYMLPSRRRIRARRAASAKQGAKWIESVD